MRKIIFILAVVISLSGCYTFKGASIPPEMKTINISLFENRAPLVIPTLSNNFTEALKTIIRNQSKLTITQQQEVDASFTGEIIDYNIKPIAIQDNTRPVAGANRLTITVKVKYINNIKDHEKEGFDESFTAFTDFTLGGQSLQAIQESLIKKVNDQLTENIFNRAFSQW